MPKLTITPGVTLALDLTLNESEARALDALAGYSVDAFLKTFYREMGRHYLEPEEAGLRSLFAQIRATVPPALTAVDDARKRLRAAGLNIRG